MACERLEGWGSAYPGVLISGTRHMLCRYCPMQAPPIRLSALCLLAARCARVEVMSFAIAPPSRRRRRRSLLLTIRPLRCMTSWKIVALLSILQIQKSASFGTSRAFLFHHDRHVLLVDAPVTPAAAAAAAGAATSAESLVIVKVKRSSRNPVDTSQVQHYSDTLLLSGCTFREVQLPCCIEATAFNNSNCFQR